MRNREYVWPPQHSVQCVTSCLAMFNLSAHLQRLAAAFASLCSPAFSFAQPSWSAPAGPAGIVPSQFSDGVMTPGIARWGLPLPTCSADFNRTDGVTLQDLFDFLAAYFCGALNADFNQSGAVSVQDLFRFLDAYFSACG